MENLGFYNGEYDLIENMKIPMNDRACYFGDGVYDATFCANHTIFALDDHIERFYNSAGLLGIEIPCTKQELGDLLTWLVKKVDSPEQFVYWQVTRGTAPRNHAYPDSKANLWVTLKPLKSADIAPFEKKYKLITVEDTRFYHCNAKTLNLLPNVLASEKAKRAGCDEVVFHRGDRVTECAHNNVSILKDGIFRTAPTDNLILPGIARKHMIQICKDNNIPVDETPFTVKDLMEADEVIVSASSLLAIQAIEIDGIPVGGKAPELLKFIQDEYLKIVKEKTGLKK